MASWLESLKRKRLTRETVLRRAKDTHPHKSAGKKHQIKINRKIETSAITIQPVGETAPVHTDHRKPLSKKLIYTSFYVPFFVDDKINYQTSQINKNIIKLKTFYLRFLSFHALYSYCSLLSFIFYFNFFYYYLLYLIYHSPKSKLKYYCAPQDKQIGVF